MNGVRRAMQDDTAARPHGWVVQDVGRFTVEVSDPVSGCVVGTGFVVGHDGQILTSSRVLANALGAEERKGGSGGRRQRQRPAAAARGRPGGSVDAACGCTGRAWSTRSGTSRSFSSSSPPVLHDEQVAVLGTAAGSAGHPFLSLAHGKPEIPGGARLRGRLASTEPERMRIDLLCADLDERTAGAPVLDEQRQLVVGVTVAPDSRPTRPGQRIAAGGLDRTPFGLTVEESFEPRPGATQPARRRRDPGVRRDGGGGRRVNGVPGGSERGGPTPTPVVRT